jgi:hypothetical protein
VCGARGFCSFHAMRRNGAKPRKLHAALRPVAGVAHQ